MPTDRRYGPGPGQYEPKRTVRGDAPVIGETNASWTSVKHGFSVDNGPSRDTSLRDYAITGPWPTYPTAKRSTSAFVAVTPSGSGPGPDDIPGCVGPQVVSTKRNAPIAAFGKSERFHHKTETKPGPGEYDTNAGVTLKPGSPSWSLGLKLDSTIYKNMPIDTPGAKYDAHKALEMGGHLDLSHSAAVDHAPRMSRNKDNGVPGPGNYKNVVSIGKQKLSQFVTEPTINFTKKLRLSDLPNGDPVFISHQHSSENIGKHGPGPAVHVGRMTCDGSLFIGGSLDTKYGTKTRPIGFCKEKKLRPQSTEGFWNPNNPGPGAYTTTTSIGKQVQSKNPTSPYASKTTMERAVWDKQFVSAEHLKVESQGKDSPGPMYEPVVTSKGACLVSASKCGAPFGKGKRDATDLRISSPGPAAYSISRDFDERLPSPQKMVGRGAEKGSSFGNEKRPCLQVFDELAPRGDLYLSRSIDQTLLQGYESPGPGQYINGTESSQLLTSFGKGSTISNSEPTWKIGTSKRIMMSAPRGSEGQPGPGAYSSPSSMGKQAYSRAINSANVTIPKSERDKAAKLFISRMHSESAAQSSSPGPAAYMKNDTTWKMSSKKKRSPSFGFGSSQRSNFLFL